MYDAAPFQRGVLSGGGIADHPALSTRALQFVAQSTLLRRATKFCLVIAMPGMHYNNTGSRLWKRDLRYASRKRKPSVRSRNQTHFNLQGSTTMAFSLYAATVPSCMQILRSVSGLIEKAEAFCSSNSIAPDEIIQLRLADDMLPFCYQVKSTAVHSLGAIEAVRRGVFSPDMTPPPATFAALTARLAETLDGLAAIKPDEIDGFIGRDMRFSFGERHLDFTAEDFLLSFSQPNFYFHATTTYDLLRWKGVPLGKRDFMGRPRVKQ